MASPHQYAIAPIDLCYGLVGLVKANWDGISGGTRIEGAIAGFFDELRERTERWPVTARRHPARRRRRRSSRSSASSPSRTRPRPRCSSPAT